MKAELISISNYIEGSFCIRGGDIRRVEQETGFSLAANSAKYIGKHRLDALKYCWLKPRELKWTSKNEQKDWNVHSLCMLDSGKLFRVRREWLSVMYEACLEDKQAKIIRIEPEAVESYLRTVVSSDLIRANDNLKIGLSNLSIPVYNWLCGFDMAGDRFKAKNFKKIIARIYDRITGKKSFTIAQLRTQAANAYPLLPFMIAESQIQSKTESTFIYVDEINSAISEQSSLNEALAINLNVPKWSVRKLAGFKPEDFSTEYFGIVNGDQLSSSKLHHQDLNANLSIAEIISQASSLKPEFWPKNSMEWNSFIYFSSLAQEMYAGTKMVGFEKTRFLNDFQSNWLLPAESLRLDHEDVSNDICANLILPTSFLSKTLKDMPSALAQAIAKEILWTGKNLNRVAETISLWHSREGDIRRKLSEQYPIEGEADEWASISEDFTASNNYQVISLHSKSALIEDGTQLNHCVGRYVTDCIYGDSHILSVLDREGKKISTCEVSDFSNSSEGVRLSALRKSGLLAKQHRGKNNVEPPKECQTAIKEWLRGVREETVKVDWQAIDGVRRQILLNNPSRWRKDKFSSSYLASTSESVYQAWQEYSIFLPKHIKAIGPENFVLEIEKIAESLYKN